VAGGITSAPEPTADEKLRALRERTAEASNAGTVSATSALRLSASGPPGIDPVKFRIASSR
jgi:hypothetical protein